MPRPLSSNIHQWAKYAAGKNDALMTNSAKHALNSDAGIALCSGAIVVVDTDVAMQNLARASCPGGTRTPSTNRTNSLEKILSNEVVMAGFSRRDGLIQRQPGHQISAARQGMLVSGKCAVVGRP